MDESPNESDGAMDESPNESDGAMDESPNESDGGQCFWCDGTNNLTQTVHQEQGIVFICRNCKRDLEGSSYGGSSYGSPDVEDPGHEDSWSDESDHEEHGARFRSSILVSG